MAQISIPASNMINRTCKSWSQVTYMATPPLQRGRKKYFTPLQKNDEEGANRPQFELTFSNFDYTTKSAAAQQKSPVDIGEKRNYNKDREKVSCERFAPSLFDYKK